MKKILILLAVCALLLSAFSLFTPKNKIKSIQVGNTVLDRIEIADTNAKRERGLSGRNSIEANYGMLFTFQTPAKYEFWMKDMNFAIDMIWLDADWKVVGLKKDAKPESYPEAFGPEENSLYVLEVVSGLIQKENLKIGDHVKFTK